jgi:general stress protein 26
MRTGILCETINSKKEKYMRDIEKTVGNQIDKAGVSIISSVDETGFPNTKAMIPPRKREGIRYIYFTTNTSSMRVKQYFDNPKACVYFFDKRFFRGIMLLGTMEVLQDKASKEMIWKDGDEMYYSKGVTDPDYCVLKFTADTGRYYSNFKSVNFTVEQETA